MNQTTILRNDVKAESTAGEINIRDDSVNYTANDNIRCHATPNALGKSKGDGVFFVGRLLGDLGDSKLIQS